MMKTRFKKFFLVPAFALAISVVTVLTEPADARVYVSGRISVQFDSCGFPIWGYGNYGRPIYAYDPYGVPIHVVTGIYPGCFVPTWGPAPYYRGPHAWPRGVCRGRYQPCVPPPPPCFLPPRPFPHRGYVPCDPRARHWRR